MTALTGLCGSASAAIAPASIDCSSIFCGSIDRSSIDHSSIGASVAWSDTRAGMGGRVVDAPLTTSAASPASAAQKKRGNVTSRAADGVGAGADRDTGTGASTGRDARKRAQAPRKTRLGYDETLLRLQVALDRAGYSVGVIDGQRGAKTRSALAAYQRDHELPETAKPDAAAWSSLGDAPPTVSYDVTDADVAGPFVEEIPKDLEAQGQLEQLAYSSPLEMLSERFHTAPALLRALNPRLTTVEANQTLVVPNVDPMTLPEKSGRRRDPKPAAAARSAAASAESAAGGIGSGVSVTVSESARTLTVKNDEGVTLFRAPVSSGSAHDPLPIGEWTVRGVYLLPRFFYNPALFWDADASHAKTRIAAGPNNPVGVVWMDLDRPHYGLHGTPEPAAVGVTQSHGCVRLTNWDALRVAALITDGTPVHFIP